LTTLVKSRQLEETAANAQLRYSTVTLFARFRGWSTSVPLSTAV
jgi:hypothetical protein